MSLRTARCRLCDSTLPKEPALHLPPTPPANAFVATRGEGQTKHSLDYYLCAACGSFQLGTTVDPFVLFEDYKYTTASNPGMVEHLRRFVEELTTGKQPTLEPDDTVVEIGSNDGTFLQLLADKGIRGVGYEPASRIARESKSRGLSTITAPFCWASVQAQGLAGRAKLVYAANVCAHVADAHELVSSAKLALAAGGSFVFEVAYLRDMLEKGHFDSCYSEHVYVHAIRPLRRLLALHKLPMTSVERIPTHGGSIRVRATLQAASSRGTSVEVEEKKEEAARLYDPETYVRFSNRIAAGMTKLQGLLSNLEAAKYNTPGASGEFKLAGYGAPAKLTTFCYRAGFTPSTIAYVVDDSPWKQGLYTPGLHYAVVTPSRLLEDPPDAILLFAWNVAESIVPKIRAIYSTEGRRPPPVVIPFPIPHVAQ